MKLIRHKETDKVLGVHIAGDDAAEMIRALLLPSPRGYKVAI